MNTVIDDTTNATISVTERIQDATDEINKNYELSKELDAGFEKVDTSVRAGNNEVNVVKKHSFGDGRNCWLCQRSYV